MSIVKPSSISNKNLPEEFKNLSYVQANASIDDDLAIEMQNLSTKNIEQNKKIETKLQDLTSEFAHLNKQIINPKTAYNITNNSAKLMHTINQLDLEDIPLTQALKDDINDWLNQYLNLFNSSTSSKNIEEAFKQRLNLISEGQNLVHQCNEHTLLKLPFADKALNKVMTMSSSHAKPNYSSDDINIYLIMLNMVLLTNSVVMEAVNMETQMTGILNDMMNNLNSYLALLNIVNKAFKDMQAQAALENANNQNLNPGWTSKTADGKYDMFDLLSTDGKSIPINPTPKEEPTHVPKLEEWIGNIRKEGDKISLCFYTGADPSDMLKQFYSNNPPADNKYFLNEDQMTKLLQQIGNYTEVSVGGNLATQNPMCFKSVAALTGLTNAVTSAIGNLQSQTTASSSRLGIDNQGLMSQINNYTTLVSNMLSVMMKLFSIG